MLCSLSRWSSMLEGFKACFCNNLLSFKYSSKRLLMDSEFLVATTVYSEFKGIWCFFFVKCSTLLVHAGSLAFLKPVVHTTVLANAQMFVMLNFYYSWMLMCTCSRHGKWWRMPLTFWVGHIWIMLAWLSEGACIVNSAESAL